MLYFEKGLYTSTYMSLFYPFLINLLLVLKKKHILLFLIHGQMIQNMLKFYCLFEDQSD